MRIVGVELRVFDGKRLKAVAAVVLDNGRRLRNIRVINVKSEYFVILPPKNSMLADIGEKKADRFFFRTLRELVLTELIHLMAQSGPLACEAGP